MAGACPNAGQAASATSHDTVLLGISYVYVIVAIKLILGLLALVLVINLTGKGNPAPASASDQVQNYVLGGIVGGGYLQHRYFHSRVYADFGHLVCGSFIAALAEEE